jgi:WD40 repeat protein
LLIVVALATGIELFGQEPHAAVDLSGDALPAGAVARLGSSRLRHRGPITALAMAADGSFVVAASDDGAVRVWDMPSGRLRRRVDNLPHGLTDVAVSPDGKQFAAAGPDSRVRLVSVETGSVRAVISELAGRPRAIAFSADGGRLVIETTSSIELRDAATGRGRKLADGATFALSPDGQSLAYAGGSRSDPELILRNVESGSARSLKPAPRTEVNFLAFTADGRRLVVQDGPDRLELRDAASGEVVHRFASPAGVSILAVALAADGRTLAASLGAHDAPQPDANRRTVLVWDVGTGKESRRLDVWGRGLSHIALDRAGRVLALGGNDGTVHGFDLATGKARPELTSHAGRVNAIAFAPDGRTLASAGEDGTVRLWEVPSGRPGPLLRGHAGPVAAVAFAPGGRTLATAGRRDRTVRVWDVAATRERFAPLTWGEAVPTAVAFTPDGHTLAVALEGGQLRLLDPANGKEKTSPGQLELPSPGTVAYSADGSLLVVGSRRDDDNVHVVRVLTADGSQELRSLTGLPQALTDVAISPGGRLLAAVGRNLHVWEIASGCELYQRGYLERVRAGVAFSPDARFLATGELDGVVCLLEPRTGKVLHQFQVTEGLDPVAPAVAFSPDGHLLATSCDNTVLLWDLTAARPPAPAAPARADLDALWADLASADGPKAVRAVGNLAADPARAMPFLSERLGAVAFPKPDEVAKRIAALGDESFAKRRAATRELTRLGRWVEPALRQASLTEPEAQRRRAELLKNFADPTKAVEVLRVARAVWALELIGTPEARESLRRLAARSGPMTDAGDALRRLDANRTASGR